MFSWMYNTDDDLQQGHKKIKIKKKKKKKKVKETIKETFKDNKSPVVIELPPIPPLPEDYVYSIELPPLKYGMPPLPKEEEVEEENYNYVKTEYGYGKITKIRDDGMLEVDLDWESSNNNLVQLIINETDVEYIPSINKVSSNSDMDDILEYSDTENEEILQIVPISIVTQKFSLSCLYFLGGLYFMMVYLIIINLLRHMIC